MFTHKNSNIDRSSIAETKHAGKKKLEKTMDTAEVNQIISVINDLIMIGKILHKYNNPMIEQKDISKEIRAHIIEKKIEPRIAAYQQDDTFPKNENINSLCKPCENSLVQIDLYETLFEYIAFFIVKIQLEIPRVFFKAFTDLNVQMNYKYDSSLIPMLEIINGFYYYTNHNNYPASIKDIIENINTIEDEINHNDIMKFHELLIHFIEIEFTKKKANGLTIPNILLPEEIANRKRKMAQEDTFTPAKKRKTNTDLEELTASNHQLNQEIRELEEAIGAFLQADFKQLSEIKQSPKGQLRKQYLEDKFGADFLANIATQLTQPSADPSQIFVSFPDYKTSNDKESNKSKESELKLQASLNQDIRRLEKTIGVLFIATEVQFNTIISLPYVQQAKILLENKFGKENLLGYLPQPVNATDSQFDPMLSLSPTPQDSFALDPLLPEHGTGETNSYNPRFGI